MESVVKLTKKQAEKLKSIQDYLDTEIGKGGALCDSWITTVYSIKKVYQNATGICVKGFKPDNFRKNGQIVDRIQPRDITILYSAIKRQDEDFKIFLETK